MFTHSIIYKDVVCNVAMTPLLLTWQVVFVQLNDQLPLLVRVLYEYNKEIRYHSANTVKPHLTDTTLLLLISLSKQLMYILCYFFRPIVDPI